MLDSGEYFQCPTKAKEAYLVPVSDAVKDIVEKADQAVIDTFSKTHPSEMDKRTKEYKDWKASQEEADA